MNKFEMEEQRRESVERPPGQLPELSDGQAVV